MGKAKIDPAKCLGCGACTGVCPTGAVTIGPDGKAVVDESKCVGCASCCGQCPAGAIELK